jgi:hypothetical protein
LPIFIKHNFLSKVERYKAGKKLIPLIFKNKKTYIKPKYTDSEEDYYFFELDRGNYHDSGVSVYVPNFDWLDEFFGFNLTDNQKEFIKNEFFSLSDNVINGKFDDSFEFKKNFKVNLIEIIKKVIFDSLTLFTIGYSLYGDNFKDASKIYQKSQEEEFSKLHTGKEELYDNSAPFIAVQKAYPITLNKYNFILIQSALSRNAKITSEEIMNLARYFVKKEENTKKPYLDDFNLDNILCFSLSGYPHFFNDLNKKLGDLNARK